MLLGLLVFLIGCELLCILRSLILLAQEHQLDTDCDFWQHVLKDTNRKLFGDQYDAQIDRQLIEGSHIKCNEEESYVGVNELEDEEFADQAILVLVLIPVVLPVSHGHCQVFIEQAKYNDDNR